MYWWWFFHFSVKCFSLDRQAVCCWCLRATLLKAHSTQAKSFLNGPRSFRLPFLACTFAFSHRYRIGVYFVHFIMKISRQMTSNNTDTGAFAFYPPLFYLLLCPTCLGISCVDFIYALLSLIMYRTTVYVLYTSFVWLAHLQSISQPSDLCWWHNRCVYKMKFHTYKIIMLMWNVNIKYWCLQAVFKHIF